MSYAVKEIFYTLQGEGAQAGRAAVFCRFAGCNLWSGREQDRAAAVCRFCDTDFIGVDGPGGGKFDSASAVGRGHRAEMARRAPRSESDLWSAPAANRCCNWMSSLIAALHECEFQIAVETNGTVAAPPGVDWLCVSPKAGSKLHPAQRRRVEAGLSANGSRSGGFRIACLSGISFCSRWMGRIAPPTQRLRCAIVLNIRSGA